MYIISISHNLKGAPVLPAPQQRHYCGTGGATMVKAVSFMPITSFCTEKQAPSPCGGGAVDY
jgi:hypothetical protein